MKSIADIVAEVQGGHVIVNRLKEAENKLRTLMILTVLEKHNWDKDLAADELGITRPALNYNLLKLKIVPSRSELLVKEMKIAHDLLHRVRPNQNAAKAKPIASATAANGNEKRA